MKDWKEKMSTSNWSQLREQMPQRLRLDGCLTDIALHVHAGTEKDDDDADECVVFRAHKVILASHSDYFRNLFQSGMRESDSGVVHFRHGVDADTLRRLLDYIYTGKVDCSRSFERMRDLMAMAHMWQINDLERAIFKYIDKHCSIEYCLRIYVFLHYELPNRCQDASETYFASGLVLEQAVRQNWKKLVTPEEKHANNDFVWGLRDLELPWLKDVLAIKSSQEEPSDFTFSFNQSDLCQAVILWVRHDLVRRHAHLHELASFYCLHQINAHASKALDVLYQDIEQLLDPADLPAWKLALSVGCRGQWCPRNPITGLVVAHAWSPSPPSRLASDHIFFNFVVPSDMASAESRRLPLSQDVFYDLGQFGEMGEGEKHGLFPNNCLPLSSSSSSSYMLLTINNDSLSGTVVDAVSSSHECGHHHNSLWRFCPSTVRACSCGIERLAVCADTDSGFVYAMPCSFCQPAPESLVYNPCCETFRILPPLPAATTTNTTTNTMAKGEDVCNRSVVFHNGLVYAFGGYSLPMDTSGAFSYTFCTYDLNDHYSKSGYALVKTSMVCLSDTPRPSHACHSFDVLESRWDDLGQTEFKPPFELGDSAVVIKEDKLYVIGGSDVHYDSELKMFFQRPRQSVWIFSFTTRTWKQGPCLPQSKESATLGFTRCTAYCYRGRIFVSGGACLRVNSDPRSNQIYEYVPNTKVFVLDEQEEAWQLTLDVGGLDPGEGATGLGNGSRSYSVLAIFPTKVALPRIKIKKSKYGKCVFFPIMRLRKHGRFGRETN